MKELLKPFSELGPLRQRVLLTNGLLQMPFCSAIRMQQWRLWVVESGKRQARLLGYAYAGLAHITGTGSNSKLATMTMEKGYHELCQ